MHLTSHSSFPLSLSHKQRNSLLFSLVIGLTVRGFQLHGLNWQQGKNLAPIEDLPCWLMRRKRFYMNPCIKNNYVNPQGTFDLQKVRQETLSWLTGSIIMCRVTFMWKSRLSQHQERKGRSGNRLSWGTSTVGKVLFIPSPLWMFKILTSLLWSKCYLFQRYESTSLNISQYTYNFRQNTLTKVPYSNNKIVTAYIPMKLSIHIFALVQF